MSDEAYAEIADLRDRLARSRWETRRAVDERDALREALRKQADEWNDEMAMLGQGIAKDLAEKRALLGRIAEATGYVSKLSPLSDEQGLILPKLGNALSPPQETDPE